MRTKLMGIAMTAVLASSAFAGIASAHHQDDHDANGHGMCTAYFSGSENGQGNKRDNGSAFQSFEEYVGDYDGDDDTDAYDVAAWCNDVTGGNGNPGQGEGSGYFDEEDDQDPSNTCGEDQHPCDYSTGGGTGDDGDNGNENPPGQG